MYAKQDRKSAIREYKERKTQRGIFAVRCTKTGRAWVELAPNLEAAQNAEFFQLRLGSHRNTDLQAEWNAQGADAFHYEVLETLADDLSPLALKDALKSRKEHWVNTLEAQRLSSR